MSITSSEIVRETPQGDGRRKITERHIDERGERHFFSYLADEGLNVSEVMLLRAERLAEILRQRWEAELVIDEWEAPATLSRADFMRRVPDAKKGALLRAKETDDQLLYLWELMAATGAVVLDGDEAAQARGYLVAAGYLTEAEAEAVFSHG